MSIQRLYELLRWHCTILQHTSTDCHTPHNTETHRNTQKHVAPHCITRLSALVSIRELQHTAQRRTATHYNTLQHAATRWTIVHEHPKAVTHTASHCITLQHTATHCNTLQHTVTHCNTLQHTATHCNILQHASRRSLEIPKWCKAKLQLFKIWHWHVRCWVMSIRLQFLLKRCVWMRLCVHVCVCVCLRAFVCAFVSVALYSGAIAVCADTRQLYTFIHIYLYMYKYMYIHICIYICICTHRKCAYACNANIFVCVSIPVCVYACVVRVWIQSYVNV